MSKEVSRRVDYAQSTIAYRLRWADTNRLSITVAPEGNVSVRAPSHATAEEVDGRVLRRAKWILRQLDELVELGRLRQEKRYVSGETHRYLGRQYRLKVRASETTSVKLRGGFFHVLLPEPKSLDAVRTNLDRWFREQASRVFPAILEDQLCASQLRRLEEPALVIRSMKKRWGSCTGSGKILLNPLLIHVPKACIEYVVCHELCHLIHHHHGPDFYDLLGRVMQYWRELKHLLNNCEI